MKTALVNILVLLMLVSCAEESEVSVAPDDSGPERISTSHALEPPTEYAVPRNTYADHKDPPFVDRCWLSRDSTELVSGRVTSIVGPITPADPCDLDAWVFSRPHYEISVLADDGRTLKLLWIEHAARPDEIQVGDELLAGVRTLGENTFLRRFVFVNPTRGQLVISGDLPETTDHARQLSASPACQTFSLDDAEFAQLLNARPDMNCRVERAPQLREPGEEDDSLP